MSYAARWGSVFMSMWQRYVCLLAGVQVLPLPSKDKSPGAVACLCFHAPLPGCPMWLLAVAYAGQEGRLRVYDLTSALAKLNAFTDTQLKVCTLLYSLRTDGYPHTGACL